MKKKNSGLKTLLAVGGEDVDPKLIKTMLRTKENRDLFVRTCIVFLRERNFDGLALMFLFLGKKGSSPQYKEQFTLFIKVSFSLKIFFSGLTRFNPPKTEHFVVTMIL